jgi:antitoxin (DNA-binding transcriptional repressor) of toxin-antitoxin stability system
MTVFINAKELSTSLPTIIAQSRRGVRFTVLYRNRPVFQVVPLTATAGDLKGDPLYRAKPLGRSKNGPSAAEHDLVLYAK